MAFSAKEFRKHFPQLNVKIENAPLMYLDNGASTLKHKFVCDRIHKYNLNEVANVHRGSHTLSRRGTELYESARERVQKFINASFSSEIIFTRGTTESINLVARSLVKSHLKEGDEILISSFEHHSNIVPWQMVCEEKGLQLRVAPFHREKGFDFSQWKALLNSKTKICAFLWYSNSFGNRLPIEEMVNSCRKNQTLTFVDAAQTPLSEKMDVQGVPCDFLAFSGHKMFAPYGIGILYGRKDLLEELPPYQGGGSMIDRVTYEQTSYASIPQKFEAGTPNIAGVLGLGEAIEIINQEGVDSFHSHVGSLRDQLVQGLSDIQSCEVYDFPSQRKSGIVSFNFSGVHCSDVGTLLDKYGVAIRSGHHCTQPLMAELGIEGTVRCSLAPYNTAEEVKSFLDILKKVEAFF